MNTLATNHKHYFLRRRFARIRWRNCCLADGVDTKLSFCVALRELVAPDSSLDLALFPLVLVSILATTSLTRMLPAQRHVQ